MLNIKPKTYNDVVRLSRCMELKKYIPDLTDEKIEEMYEYMKKDSNNKISVTPEMISFVNASGETESATVLETAPTGISFDHIILGAAAYNVMQRPTGDSSGCGSSCSGCSTNNNNNNNNNNG
ncbi:MAG: hypothetical protein IKA17_08010 [Clostridia bacterium]|nr:hypothetical protein [Clostridia bacterium]